MLALENAEEILQILDRYTKQKSKDIPPELDQYLNYVAKTGDTVYRWPTVQYLFREKLIYVIKEFHDTTASIEDLPQCPNVDRFNYDKMKTALLERLEHFHAAPFTIQRICELLTNPKKHYSRLDKFMRALEKNILVVSTVEPGRKPADTDENGDQSINGDILSDINIDKEIKKNIIKIAENANGNAAAKDVIKPQAEIKEIPAASTSSATAASNGSVTAKESTKPIATKADAPIIDTKNDIKSDVAALTAEEEEELKVDDIDMGLKDHELLGEESKVTETEKQPEKDATSGAKIEKLATGDDTKVNLPTDLIEQPSKGEVVLPPINIENTDNIDATIIASQLVHEPIVAKALDEVAKIIEGEIKVDVSLNEGDKLEDIGKIVSNDPILADAEIKTDDKLDDLRNSIKNDDLSKINSTKPIDKLENIQTIKPIDDIAVTPAEKHSRPADDDDGFEDESDGDRNAKKIRLSIDGEEKKTKTSILDEPIPQDILAEAVEVAEEVEAAKARELAAKASTEATQPIEKLTPVPTDEKKESSLEKSVSPVLDTEPAKPAVASDDTKPAEVETKTADVETKTAVVSKEPEEQIAKSEQPPIEPLAVEKAADVDQVDNAALAAEIIATDIPTEPVVEKKPVERIIPIELEADAKPVDEKVENPATTAPPVETNNDNQMTDGTVASSEPVNAESMAVEETDAATAAAEDAMEEGPVKADEEQMDVDESNSVDPMDL